MCSCHIQHPKKVTFSGKTFAGIVRDLFLLSIFPSLLICFCFFLKNVCCWELMLGHKGDSRRQIYVSHCNLIVRIMQFFVFCVDV